MGIKKFYFSLLVMFLFLTAFSQTWEDDSVVIRQILDTNELYNIPVDSVVGRKDINGRVLWLGFGQPSFHFLPASIKQLDQLTLFGLNETSVETIPPEIGYLKKLVVLNIIGNEKLNSLPPEIGNLDSLQTIYIQRNKLTAIPPEIGNCKNIYSLNFGENKITRIPDEICVMVSLKSISANNNLINYVPEDIGYLPKFHGINLEYNKLKHVPNSLIPFGVDDVRLCFNDSLVFTEEQKTAWGVTDYNDFFQKYCPVEVSEDGIKIKLNNPLIIINQNDIIFRVEEDSPVICSIYCISGRKIETLINNFLSKGLHTISWKRENYASGVYFSCFTMRNYKYIVKTIVR